MNWKLLQRAMAAASVAFVLALLLYAGWRGTWLPLQLALMALAVRWVWCIAPLFLVALLLWPPDDR